MKLNGSFFYALKLVIRAVIFEVVEQFFFQVCKTCCRLGEHGKFMRYGMEQVSEKSIII